MYNKFIKRILDIIFSLAVLPLFLIVLLVIAPAILIDDFGPIFYKGERLGKAGKIFKMYKFRSMKVNAPDIRNEDGTTYNSSQDNRVTKVGRFLRKTSIDEIPQVLNVLRGDMSWVGPRPDLPDAIKMYSDVVKQKLTVLPGITGYSQAYYRNSSTLEQRFEGDIFYTQNVSIGLDCKILYITVKSVLGKKNIYRNE